MATTIVKWVVQESRTPRVRELLLDLARRSRAEPGNLRYDVFQAESDPNVFILHECYASDEALEAHRQSEHYRQIVVGEIIPNLAAREVIGVRPLN